MKALSSTSYLINPYSLPNVATLGQFTGDILFGKNSPANLHYWYGLNRIAQAPINYTEELFQSRFFYRTDPTASTVINRMSELAAGQIRNKKKFASDEELTYFNGLSMKITALLQSAALEYLVAGMAVPDYATTRVMGNRMHPSLGRKRYVVPDKLWCRNPEQICLRRVPFGPDRAVFLEIPQEERTFITNKGVFSDGTEDKELYQQLVRDFPDYVKAINDGITKIPLPNVKPIFRKIQPQCDYPQPFLVPALAAMKHKLRIKEMDHSIATRALNAILHVKAGNDEFPVTEEDSVLEDLRAQLKARDNDLTANIIYQIFTDHTVSFDWVYPQLEALLTPAKYEAVDADIYMAMGFSRVLLVGEAAKSNAGAGPQIILGPFAMLEEMRWKLLEWVRFFYETLADLNNFSNIPEPIFDPLVQADTTTLVASATQALQAGVISKDTFAQFYGTDFETEQQQIEHEVSHLSNSPTIDQQVQLNQQRHTAPPNAPQQTTNPDGTINPTPEPQLPSDTLNV
jgi:hypothetical protein